MNLRVHKDITKFLGVPVYFVDPYCSWQKGAINNTNKLIRQYISKKDSFEDLYRKENYVDTKEFERKTDRKIKLFYIKVRIL